MTKSVMSKKEFLALLPYERGFVVYMAGARTDQPHIPNEPNPYRKGTRAHREWNAGAQAAVNAVVDVEE